MSSRKERNEIVRTLVMISQLGITAITCMVISLWIGIWLQRELHSPFFLILMIVIGMGAVYRSGYLLLRRFLHKEQEMNPEKEERLEQDEGSQGNTH